MSNKETGQMWFLLLFLTSHAASLPGDEPPDLTTSGCLDNCSHYVKPSRERPSPAIPGPTTTPRASLEKYIFKDTQSTTATTSTATTTTRSPSRTSWEPFIRRTSPKPYYFSRTTEQYAVPDVADIAGNSLSRRTPVVHLLTRRTNVTEEQSGESQNEKQSGESQNEKQFEESQTEKQTSGTNMTEGDGNTTTEEDVFSHQQADLFPSVDANTQDNIKDVLHVAPTNSLDDIEDMQTSASDQVGVIINPAETVPDHVAVLQQIHQVLTQLVEIEQQRLQIERKRWKIETKQNITL